MSTEVKHEGFPPTAEPDTTGILTELSDAARELAQYASYAETIGAIGHNRQHIRKWCDEVFRLCRKLDDIQWVGSRAPGRRHHPDLGGKA